METFGKKPAGYGGYWPRGDDILLAIRHRDSDCLERTNFEAVQHTLDLAVEEARKRLAAELQDAIGPSRQRIEKRIERLEEHAIIRWRAKHLACGWIEYIGVEHDAEPELLATAERLHDALDSYSVLDDEGYSACRAEEAAAVWALCNRRERLKILARYGFAGAHLRKWARSEQPPVEVYKNLDIY